MGYKVILSPLSVRDLESIVDYISRDSPEAGRKMGKALLEKAKSLKDFKGRGRAVPEFPNSDLLELILPPYRIIYRINEDKRQVEISRFWHSYRGIPKIG